MSAPPPPLLGQESSAGSLLSTTALGSNFSNIIAALANDPIGSLVPVIPRMAQMVRGALSTAGRVLTPTHQVNYDPTLDSFFDWVGQSDGSHSSTLKNFDAVLLDRAENIAAKKGEIVDRTELILVEDDRINKLRAAKKLCEGRRDRLEGLRKLDEDAIKEEEEAALSSQIQFKISKDILNKAYKPWTVSVRLLYTACCDFATNPICLYRCTECHL